MAIIGMFFLSEIYIMKANIFPDEITTYAAGSLVSVMMMPK